ncbi:hypothetical protein BHM03_00047774, partial [Ensete ventricosum]
IQDQASGRGSDDAAGACWEFVEGDRVLTGSTPGVHQKMIKSSPRVHRRVPESLLGV